MNVRSLRNKLEEFELLLNSLDFPEIVCISEINYNEREISTINLEMYKLTDFFCRKNHRLGGVAIVIKKDLNFRIKTCSVKKTEMLFEYALIEIILKDSCITVGCFYRSPSNRAIDAEFFAVNMDELLNSVYDSNYPTFLCGDFNFNFDDSVEDINAKNLCNILCCFGLNKCITEYTRIQGESKTIIDNIFSNVDKNLLDPKIIYADISDHFMQLITFCRNFNTNEEQNTYQLKRFFNNVDNLNYFKFLLSQEKWSFMATDQNCETSFTDFHNTFLELMDRAFPLESCKVQKKYKSYKPWITNDIINEGVFLRDLHKTYKLSGDNAVYLRYKIIKKNHRIKIEQAKKSHFENKFLNSTNKSKTAWQIIKNSNDKKEFPKNFVDPDGNDINNLQNVAETFNNFFIDSIKTLTDNMPSTLIDNKQVFNHNTIFLFPFSPNEMLVIIKSVSTKNSSGYDDIPCSLLNKVAELIVEPLTFLVNLSFTEGIFPDILKKSLIVPIHKKNDRSVISNYRGIALLSVFSKTFEKSYYVRLNDFIIKQNLLSTYQFGFRKGLSTKDAVLSLHNYILDNFENKRKSACLFFDLTRAFDTVDHKLLLSKLRNCGIRGPALSWIESYLRDRTQSVVLRDAGKIISSNYLEISTGVPQGSILGPLLFILFIDNIALHIDDVFVSLFADDSTIAVNSNDIDELSLKASNTIRSMQNYCESTGLALNNVKTDLLLFSTRKPDYSLFVKIDNCTVKQSNSVKFLGVYMDSLLNWGTQVDFVINKLSTHCFVIWQLRSFVNIHILKMYYFAHVQSCLNYCIICWGNCSRFSEVFTLQKKIVRTMSFKPPRHSCRLLFRELGILTAPSLYILNCVLYIKEHYDQFNSRNDTPHNLRDNHNLNIPVHTLSIVAKGPKLMSVKLFNKLPFHIKKINVIQLFKKEAKSLLLKHSFYSVDEYLGSNLIDESR